MTPEFQIIFTAIITLLAGLSLFILRSVMKKFDDATKVIISIQDKMVVQGERIVAIETKLNLCRICGRKTGDDDNA